MRSGPGVAADPSSPLFDKLADIVDNAPPSVHADVDAYVQKVLKDAQANNGVISASDVVDMSKSKSQLSGYANSDRNPAAPQYSAIQDAIKSEFGNGLSGDAAQAWTDANNSFRSLSTVERARDPKTGIVTPASLATAVKGSRYESLLGDYGQLAEAGARFVPPPTAEKPVVPTTMQDLWRTTRELGIGTMGAEGLGRVGEMAGLPVDPQVVGGIGAALAPAAVLANRASRLGAYGPPAPSPAAYYARTLMTPGLYVGAGTATPPGTPGLVGTYAPGAPQWARNWGP